MAEAPELFSEQELTCSICLDLFTDPVSTPCGHNFCQVSGACSAPTGLWERCSAETCLCVAGLHWWLLGVQPGVHVSAVQASV